MGRLGGFSYREVADKLAALGFSIHRQAKGSHEIWKHQDGRYVTLPNHKVIKEGTLRTILKQAMISPEEFLKA